MIADALTYDHGRPPALLFARDHSPLSHTPETAIQIRARELQGLLAPINYIQRAMSNAFASETAAARMFFSCPCYSHICGTHRSQVNIRCTHTHRRRRKSLIKTH